MIQGDGINRYPTKKIDVYCDEETLETVARAMIKYIRNFEEGGGCCCLAKEGGGVTNNDFDIMFADCM